MRGFLGTDEFVEVVAQHTRNVLYFPITHGLGTLHDPTFSDRTTVNWEKREKLWDGCISGFKETWHWIRGIKSRDLRYRPKSARLLETKICWSYESVLKCHYYQIFLIQLI
jgi:hypothetical protein